MNKPSSRLLQLIGRRAGFTLHQLVDEIQLLTVSFPDLRDAFDADELPISFILKRDAEISPEPEYEEPIRAAREHRDGRES